VLIVVFIDRVNVYDAEKTILGTGSICDSYTVTKCCVFAVDRFFCFTVKWAW